MLKFRFFLLNDTVEFEFESSLSQQQWWAMYKDVLEKNKCFVVPEKSGKHFMFNPMYVKAIALEEIDDGSITVVIEDDSEDLGDFT